jgi:hypothetical protein
VRRTVPPSAEIEAQIDQLLAVGVGENPRESLSESRRARSRRRQRSYGSRGGTAARGAGSQADPHAGPRTSHRPDLSIGRIHPHTRAPARIPHEPR